MKMRYIILAIAALFAIGPAVSHADDGLRIVGITFPRVVAALGYTPLNPGNNLSEVATPATARSNLGLGTAATVNTGTSGATIPLLNTANTFGANQTIPSVLLSPGGSIAGSVTNSVNVVQSDGGAGNSGLQLWGSASANPGLLALFGKTISVQPGAGGFTVAGAPYGVSKLSAAPTTAPGAGLVFIFALAGTNSGTCKLQALAGTSTTPFTIADNVGGGC